MSATRVIGCIVFAIVIVNSLHPNILVDPNDASRLGTEGLDIVADRIEPRNLQRFRTFFHQDKTFDYSAAETELIPYIRMLVNAHLNWETQFSTFRCSSGTHIVGANGFHRDQFDYTTATSVLPVYTVIVYLDDSEFEYIPGSHLFKEMNVTTAFWMTSKSKKLNLPAGSIVVMNGTTVHRAVRPTDDRMRRVLQFFVTLPSTEDKQRLRGSMMFKWNSNCGKRDQTQWLRLVLPLFNFVYSVQQMCNIQIPGARNFISQKMRRNKLVTAFGMPVRTSNDDDHENLYVLLDETLNHYEPNCQ